MRRGTIFIILFVLIAAALVAATTLLRSQPPVEIDVAVDPLAEPWLRAAALEFNTSGVTVGVGRPVRVNVIVAPGMQILNEPWSSNNHPDGWIPAWSAFAAAIRMSVTTNTEALSLARTPLVWMRDASDDSPISALTWDGVQEAAASNRINIAFSSPSLSVQGFAVLLSGAADFHDSGVLADAQLNDRAMRDWLLPVIESVPSFNTIPNDVAQYVAGPQGRTVDVAIGPESQWLTSLSVLARTYTPEFAYPDYPVMFDFPYITLSSVQTTDDERAASQAFAAFLLNGAQQGALDTYGLRPAVGEPAETSDVFIGGERYGIMRQLPVNQAIQLPQPSAISGLRQWILNNGG
ncbi:MAG: substrate-binding domain-containing protein [Chloroflexi bacterium]|nr:substrate-binding domain-containing protein [Chloroflexota bacterium]